MALAASSRIKTFLGLLREWAIGIVVNQPVEILAALLAQFLGRQGALYATVEAYILVRPLLALVLDNHKLLWPAIYSTSSILAKFGLPAMISSQRLMPRRKLSSA